MKSLLLALVGAVGLAVGTARAEVPAVAADIAPVHALTARVMEGAGTPALIVPPGASPHGHAMRPSETAALDRAALVVWMGADLTPWMAGAIDTLAADARVIALLEAAETATLPLRDSGHDHDGHGHAGADPHAWLDPDNAARWLGLIAEELAALDPDNAALYRANAAAGQAELAALAARIEARLAPLAQEPFFVYHDAFQYFETRFGLRAAGAVAPGDASGPGPARLAALRAQAEAQGVSCLFAEPQTDAGRLTNIFGAGMRIGVLDPAGTALEPGPGLYARLLQDMAAAMPGCLGAGG